MKKLQTLILVTIAIAFTACHSGTHIIITSSDNNSGTRLELWGNVMLNDSHSAIRSISSSGYVDYKKDQDDLHITNDNDGRFHYELNGNKTDHLDETGRLLLEEVVEKIAKLQSGH